MSTAAPDKWLVFVVHIDFLLEFSLDLSVMILHF